MRSGPGTNYATVTTVPAKSELLVCADLFTPATYEGIKGNWRKVNYKNKIGYMFDGFLAPVTTSAQTSDFKIAQLLIINKILAQDISKLDSVLTYLTQVAIDNGYEKIIGPPLEDKESNFEQETEVVAEEEKTPEKEEVKEIPVIDFKMVTEAYNYCGDITELDPGKLWYSIYKKGNEYFLKRTDILILRSKYSLGTGLEFDIKADKGEKPTFLIQSSKRLDTNWYVTEDVDFFVRNPKSLYPGQMVEIYAKDPVADIHNVTLFATGNVTNVGLCPEMTDYKIQVTGEMNDDLIVQNLTPMFTDLGTCGIPEIFWFGDINQDLYPDVIFLSTGENGLSFTFFVSDTRKNNVLYRKAFEWFNHNCE